MCESDVKQQNWKYSIIRKEFYLILRQTPSSLLVKVPISSKLLFSHLIPYFMRWTPPKKIFDLDEKRIFYECLKTWKSYFLTVNPYRWSQHRHAQNCDVDSGTCEFRLDLYRLFYLCKFSFVVHAKSSFPAFCMNYWVKFTELKQAR